MPKRSSKTTRPAKKLGRPRNPDPNQLARFLIDAAAGDVPKEAPTEPQDTPAKNPAAVALGKLGGAKGGPARAASLSRKKRSEIAKKAARARWSAKIR